MLIFLNNLQLWRDIYRVQSHIRLCLLGIGTEVSCVDAYVI